MSDFCEKDKLNYKLRVYAELKPQLASAQIFIKILQNCYRRKVTLNVKKTSVEIKWSKKNVHELVFEGVRFVPTTCHSMQWVAKDQLHFRVQVYDRERTNGNLIYEPQPTRDLLKSFKGDEFMCSCSKCGQHLVEPQRFLRVLPLPSDNWYEMADSLFCCKHKKTSTPEKHKNDSPIPGKPHVNGNASETKSHATCENGDGGGDMNGSLSLQPKVGDCLVGETHFMVHGASVIQQNIDVDKQSGNVICSSCRFVVGQNMVLTQQKNGCVRPKCKVAAVKFFTLNVNLHVKEDTAGATIPESPTLTLEQNLAELLVTHSKQYNSYRLVIESKQQHSVQPFILIWMLDAKCYQYVGETSSETDDTKQCTVKSQGVIKLMYKDCLREQNISISDSWCKDMTVHSIDLPHQTCVQLLDILVENTRKLQKAYYISESWCKDMTVHSIDLPHQTCVQLLDLLVENTRKLPTTMKSQNINGNNFYVGYLEKAESAPLECDNRNEVSHTRTD